MTFRITITNPGPKFQGDMERLADRVNRVLDTTMNMIQSLLITETLTDIASAGNFGARWTDGLHVNLEGAAPNMRLYMTHDIPYADIFETGGTIHGSPLLWIPLSGTNAEGIRASAFGDGLFSVQGRSRPLLFSVTDRQPKYFGIESVTIPKTFHLTEDVNTVMASFRSIFIDAWKAAV